MTETKKPETPKASPRPDPKRAPWPPRFSLEDWREALEETRQKELRNAPKTVQVFPVGD